MRSLSAARCCSGLLNDREPSAATAHRPDEISKPTVLKTFGCALRRFLEADQRMRRRRIAANVAKLPELLTSLKSTL
jgi:hypothetical protein